MLIPKEERVRDKGHLKFVRALPCFICGAWGCDAHHLLKVHKKGMGLKNGDDYTIPLCMVHHRSLHNHGDEIAYFASYGYDYAQVIEFVKNLYERTLQRVKKP